MGKKKSFILYYDQQDIFEMLSNEEAGELIKTIYKVVQNQETDLTFNGRKHMQMALVPILKTLERNKEKYEETCERNRKNAQKRWQDEKCDHIQTYTNYADNDSDNESDNDNDSDSDSGISPPIKEDILKSFNVIYGIYPKVDVSNKKESFEIYSQYIEGIETVEGQKRKFTPLELEIYIKDFLTKWKEKGNLERYLPPFQDFLMRHLPYFIEQGLM